MNIEDKSAYKLANEKSVRELKTLRALVECKMSIDRYDFGNGFRKSPTGDWVHYSDHAIAIHNLTAELYALRASIQEAHRFVVDFAACNPKYWYGDQLQDPWGAHAWLERNRIGDIDEI